MATSPATLSALLADVRARFAPGYRGGLTNHVPMGLIALARIGATEERMRAFIEANASSLEKARPSPRADALKLELTERGVDVVLRERLRGDLLGLAGAACHGIIRLAFATMTKDTDEIACALAYLEDNTLELDVAVAAPGTTGAVNEVAVLVEKLRAANIEKPSGPNITMRVQQVAADARFRGVLGALLVDATTLNQLSQAGARWYLAADDFPSLHALTGAAALRRLRPWTADERAADKAFAVASLALYVCAGSPARGDARGAARAEDKELKKAAIASDDDHMAKLLVAALDEEEACEDAIYRIVATRAARRGKS